MELEIIKTDNPNIVVERTTIDREINIEQIKIYKEHDIIIINELNTLIKELENKQTDDYIIKQLLDEKINRLNDDLKYHIALLEEHTKLLNQQ